MDLVIYSILKIRTLRRANHVPAYIVKIANSFLSPPPAKGNILAAANCSGDMKHPSNPILRAHWFARRSRGESGPAILAMFFPIPAGEDTRATLILSPRNQRPMEELPAAICSGGARDPREPSSKWNVPNFGPYSCVFLRSLILLKVLYLFENLFIDFVSVLSVQEGPQIVFDQNFS